VSCDWSRTRFTLDKDYARAVSAAFIGYHKAGWIYRAERVINWCPRCQTSLSDLELEYTEETGKLWYIKYPLTDHRLPTTEKNKKTVDRSPSTVDYITVATTRPETMLGDMAVAVNPDDERYKELVGKKAVLPIQNREIPVIADSAVDPAFGTGAVKVTPNHDLTDFEIAKRHNLPFSQVIDERGKMTAEAGEICAGLSTSECRAKVVEELEKQGLLEKTEDYLHRLARCYRCNSVVEPLVSKQWFLKMDELARLAIKAVKTGKVKFVPDRWSKVYLDWLENIRDWCVSRQIWWGHRLPVFFCRKKLEEFPTSNDQFPNKSQISNPQKFGNWELSPFGRCPEGTGIGNSSAAEKFVVSAKKPKQCPFCKSCDMEQSADVLDTWFSSALWPFATLGWPGKTEDLKNFYPTDVLSTARDIINLWVTRMVFSGMFFMRKEPFRTVYVHATVLTRAGQRMSKSLGTGIDPLELTEKYGADSVRFGLVWQTTGGQDMHFSEEHMLAGKKFCNKIWNASRFVLSQTGISNFQFPISKQKLNIKSKNLTTADKEILKKLDEITEETNKHLEKFEFGQALHGLYNFFWHDFCDEFIEVSKKEGTAESKQILFRVLMDSLKLLHPFIPFITEEIYLIIQSSSRQKSKKLLLIEKYPTPSRQS
jgi:valyl-tRNA synthetase